MTDRAPVQISMTVEGFGGSESEFHEVPRAEWDAMTPAQRVELAADAASTFAANYVGWGWNIEDPDDYASTTSAPKSTEVGS